MKKLFVLLLVALPGIASAQISDTAKLDAYFDALEQNDKLMGTVAVSKNGDIIYQRTLGFANAESKAKPTPQTRYRIGSISKTFTAAIALKAVAEGKLSLDSKLSAFFPEFPKSEQITVEMLLRHHSGIYNFTNAADYMTWHVQPQSASQMLKRIESLGFEFEPGARNAYSNANYVLLTYILEKVYQKPFARILEDEIAKPLKLKNTAMAAETSATAEARSYEKTDSWTFVPFTHVSVPLGAGGIVSTTEDLLAFSDALFSGKVIPHAQLEQMKSIKGGFGLGLFEVPFYEHKAFGHTGGIDGFASVFAHFPESGISYAFISNGQQINPNEVSIAVLSAIFNKPYDLPEFVDALPEEALGVYLGTYASSAVPLKITVTQKGRTLMAQATGQSSFALEPTKTPHLFKFDAAGLTMEFNPDNAEMTLRQGGGEFVFKRE